MKKVFRLLVGLLALALVFGLTGCPTSTSDKDTSTTAAAASPGMTVYGTFSGIVRGPNGLALPGVAVLDVSGNNSYRGVSGTAGTTDGNGYFKIENLISGDHTIVIGNGVVSTTTSVVIHVPTLDELKTAAALPTTTNANQEILSSTSLIVPGEGPYYVQISDPYSYDSIYYVYPCTATISGIARIKSLTDVSASAATLAPAGTKVIADFFSWNNGSPLLFTGTVTGTAGEFTLANVPAVFNHSGSIAFYLVSEGTTSGVNSYPINGDASNTTGSDSVTEPSTLPGDNRDVGTLYFVSGLMPKVLTTTPVLSGLDIGFDPGTTTTRTPIVVTFDRAMDSDLTHGTITVSDTAKTYNCAKAWSTVTLANDTLTITPDFPFENGKTISVLFTNVRAADGVYFDTDSTTTTTATLNFKVRDKLALVKSSVDRPQTPAALTAIPITDSVVLTFNYTLTGFNALNTYLFHDVGTINGTYQAGTDEIVAIATPTISGATLTIDPVASLLSNASYVLVYEATDGVTVASGTTTAGAVKFTTAEAAAAAAPTLALDTQVQAATLYNHAQAALYVQFTKGTAGTTYSFIYKRKAADEWLTDGTMAITGYDATNNFATLTLTAGGIISGETTQVIVLAKALGSTQNTPSNALSVTDQTAPVAGTLTGSSNVPYLLSDVTAPYTAFTGPQTTDTRVFFRILTGGEPILSTTLPTTTVAATILTIQGTRQISASEFWVVGTILANQTIGTGAGTMTIPLTDGAGNVYVSGFSLIF